MTWVGLVGKASIHILQSQIDMQFLKIHKHQRGGAKP